MNYDIKKKLSVSKKVILIILLLILVWVIFHTVKFIILIPYQENLLFPEIYNEYNCRTTLTYKELDEYKNTFLPNNKDKSLTDLESCRLYLKKISNFPYIQLDKLTNMNVSRGSNQQNILLKDNSVLIIDGKIHKSDLSTAEVFDPNNNKFKLVLNHPQDYYDKSFKSIYKAPILLPDGIVYFKGAIYNPKTNKFSKPKTKFSKLLLNFDKKISSKLNSNSYNQEIKKTFKDGKVLFGKNCNYQKSLGCEGVYLEDPFNKEKYKFGNFNVKRDYFNAIPLKNGNILLISPIRLTNNCDTSIFEIYNPIEGTIELLYQNNDLHFFRDNHLILENGNIFIPCKNYTNEVFGALLYNLETNQMKFEKAKLNNINYSVKPFTLSSKKVLLIQEPSNIRDICTFRPRGYVYDLETNNVFKTRYICFDNPLSTFTQLKEGKVLVTNGINCDVNNQVNISDVTTNSILIHLK